MERWILAWYAPVDVSLAVPVPPTVSVSFRLVSTPGTEHEGSLTPHQAEVGPPGYAGVVTLLSLIFGAAFRLVEHSRFFRVHVIPREQVAGIEPAFSDYETDVLPLNYTCAHGCPLCRFRLLCHPELRNRGVGATDAARVSHAGGDPVVTVNEAGIEPATSGM